VVKILLAEAFVEVSASTSKLKTGLQSARRQTETAIGKMEQTVKGFSSQLRVAGIAATAMGGAITGALALSIKTAAGFEQQMANTSSVLGGTTDQISKQQKQLGNYAREMARQTVFSAREAAGAMYHLASAGMATEEIMKSLKGTLDLAAATASGLDEATATVASTLKQYALDASEAERVSNIFSATISSSMATMDKLTASMSYVGPVAKSVGMTLEETAAILGKIYDAGIPASMAGTSLRMAMAKLSKPTKDVKNALKEMQLTVTDASGNLRPFIEIIRDLGDANMTTAQAMALFGTRAGPSMLALVSQGAASIDVLREKITGTSKATEMAERQVSTFQGQLTILRSAFEELQITVGTHFLPLLTDLVKRVKSIVDAMANWAKAHPTLTNALMKMAAVLGPMLAAGGVLMIMAPTLLSVAKAASVLAVGLSSTLVPAIKAAGAALIWLSAHPVVAAAGALTILGTALALYVSKGEDAKRVTQELVDTYSNLQNLSEIEIDVKIDKAEKSLARLSKKIWDLHERYTKVMEVYAKADGGIFGISKSEAGSVVAFVEKDLRKVQAEYDELAAALGKLKTAQEDYTYAIVRASDVSIAATEKDMRAIGEKIWKLRETEAHYKRMAETAVGQKMTKHWETGLESVRSKLEAALAEYAAADKKYQGMIASINTYNAALAGTAESTKDIKPPTEAVTGSLSDLQDILTAANLSFADLGVKLETDTGAMRTFGEVVVDTSAALKSLLKEGIAPPPPTIAGISAMMKGFAETRPEEAAKKQAEAVGKIAEGLQKELATFKWGAFVKGPEGELRFVDTRQMAKDKAEAEKLFADIDKAFAKRQDTFKDAMILRGKLFEYVKEVAAKNTKASYEAWQDMSDAIGKLIDATAKKKEKADADELKRLKSLQEKIQEAISDAKKAEVDATEKAKQVNIKAWEEQYDYVRNELRSVQYAFEDMLTGLMSGMDSFRDTWKAFWADLKDIARRKLAELIADKAFDALAAVFVGKGTTTTTSTDELGRIMGYAAKEEAAAAKATKKAAKDLSLASGNFLTSISQMGVILGSLEVIGGLASAVAGGGPRHYAQVTPASVKITEESREMLRFMGKSEAAIDNLERTLTEQYANDIASLRDQIIFFSKHMATTQGGIKAGIDELNASTEEMCNVFIGGQAQQMTKTELASVLESLTGGIPRELGKYGRMDFNIPPLPPAMPVSTIPDELKAAAAAVQSSFASGIGVPSSVLKFKDTAMNLAFPEPSVPTITYAPGAAPPGSVQAPARQTVVDNMKVEIVFPNADIMHMSRGDVETVVRTKILPALRDVERSGHSSRIY